MLEITLARSHFVVFVEKQSKLNNFKNKKAMTNSLKNERTSRLHQTVITLRFPTMFLCLAVYDNFQ